MTVDRGSPTAPRAAVGTTQLRRVGSGGGVAGTEAVADAPHATRGGTEDVLRLAFAAGRLGSWRWDMKTGRVQWDARLNEIFGFAPGGFDGRFETYLGRLHPDERERIRSEIDAAVAERRSYQLEHRILWPDGTVRWIEGIGQVSVDDNGDVTGTFGCVADVTERVVAKADRAGVLERLEFLAKVAEVLNRSLDARETLAHVVELAVPRLADVAVLFARDDGDPRLVAARHADPARDELLVELLARYPMRGDQPGLGRALATGQIQLIPDVPDRLLLATARDDRHLSMLRTLGIGAGVAVPLAIEGRVLGVLGLGLDRGRQITPDMVQTAAAMASRAAVALENSRLHSTVKTIADALQAGLAPAPPPTLPGMRVAARYVAAGAGVEVGGDFYDFVDCGDGRWLVVIGDVCGRGPGAATLNAQMRFAARALARTGLDAAQVATGLNDNVVADAEEERFCTAVVATLAPDDDGIITDLVVAGHPAPIVARRAGTLHEFGGSDNPLLGVFVDAAFTPVRTRLTHGDVLVLVTDGVLEARNPHGAFFDECRLLQVIRHAPRTAEGIADAVHAAVAAFAPNMKDDLAIVTVEAR